MSDLNASAIKKMKVTDLRAELTKRGLDAKGLKQVLIDRLMAAIEDDKTEEVAIEGEQEAESNADEPSVVTENGEQEKTDEKEAIEEVAEQPPDELMAEDTVGEDASVPGKNEDTPPETVEQAKETEATDEQENEESKADEAEAMESEEKVDETDKQEPDTIMEVPEQEEKSEGLYFLNVYFFHGCLLETL